MAEVFASKPHITPSHPTEIGGVLDIEGVEDVEAVEDAGVEDVEDAEDAEDVEDVDVEGVESGSVEEGGLAPCRVVRAVSRAALTSLAHPL